ncbi:MAG: hypothetical protein ACFFAE_05180 [Candidatus Hodarchaeota archaeon]
MKSFDVDARYLIRTYIDGIETYLRDHTRLHPNEIDSLLNEINDFVYLRSGELATGDRVHYNDVLKAIEECGSPSEICEQYLELDRDDQPGSFSPKVAHPTSEPAVVKSPEVEDYPSKSQKLPKRFQSSLNYLNLYYRQTSGFFIYRMFFIVFIVSLNVGLLWYNSLYGYRQIGVYYLHYIMSFDRCQTATMMVVFLVFLEGWLINRWKTKLVHEKGFDRSFDDSLVVYISRFSFLMLFFKASLLYIPAFLVYTPIWVILACIMERQMKSQLWEEKLGPWIISIGSTLTNDQQPQSRKKLLSLWTRFNDKFSGLEKGVMIFLIVILGITFTFPWIGLRTGYDIQTGHSYYDVSDLPEVATFFVILSLLTMGMTLAVLWYNDSSHELVTFTGESEFIAWLMRLLALKTILILEFIYTYPVFHLGSVVILGVLIVFEIVSNTYGGKTFRSWFGNVLVTFGSTSSLQRNTEAAQVPPKSLVKEQSSLLRSEPLITTPPEPTNVLQYQKGEIEPTSPRVEKIEFTRERKPSMLSGLFSGIAMLGKALVMTIWMLLISFYEMVLAFTVVATSLSATGEVIIPALTIGDYIYVFHINTWHTLLLLGIQMFFIAIVQWYGLVSKKPEGTILFVCRNMTRIFLGVVVIAAIVQLSYYGDVYGYLKLLILFGFLFFSEITAWKVRSERKKFPLLPSEQQIAVLDEERITIDRTESPKTL